MAARSVAALLLTLTLMAVVGVLGCNAGGTLTGGQHTPEVPGGLTPSIEGSEGEMEPAKLAEAGGTPPPGPGEVPAATVPAPDCPSRRRRPPRRLVPRCPVRRKRLPRRRARIGTRRPALFPQRVEMPLPRRTGLRLGMAAAEGSSVLGKRPAPCAERLMVPGRADGMEDAVAVPSLTGAFPKPGRSTTTGIGTNTWSMFTATEAPRFTKPKSGSGTRPL